MLSPKLQQIEDSFEQMFTEAVSWAVESILGQNGMQALSDKLKLRDFSRDPVELHHRLLLLFGTSGTLLIELRIINWLDFKLGCIFNIDRRQGNHRFLERNWKLAKLAFEDSRRR